MATLTLGLGSAAQDAPAQTADPPLVAPEAPPLSSGQGFSFAAKKNKTRRSVSGVACGPEFGQPGRRTCLFAFDEGVEARFGVLGADRLEPLADRIVLRSGGGELDAEAAALDGDLFYVAGSHSAKRKDCSSNPDSRHVVRFRRDPKTGLAAPDESGNPAGVADSGAKLWEIMAGVPRLAPHVGERKCLGTEAPEEAPSLRGQRGVNIEGMAAANGRLTFGFRGPAEGGLAPVLSVDEAGLFGKDPANPQLTFLDLGQRRGIRDLQAVKGGLLILTGPDDDSASDGAGWIVALWDETANEGVGKPRILARLKLEKLVRQECDEEIKPEAISVLDDRADALRVLVLSDGMCDGGPMTFRIPR